MRGISRRRNFSLVELLIVVGVIAILMSMLLPALNSAREIARRSACQGNQRQLMLACFQYVSDNGEFLPPAVYNAPPWISWTSLLAAYTNWEWNIDHTNYKWYGESTLFFCPSDKSGIAEWVVSNSHYGKNSYGCNLELMDYFGADANADGNSGSVKMSSVQKPSETILLTEVHDDDNCLEAGGGYSAKCYNSGFLFEYTVQNGTVVNDTGKLGYHALRNNWCLSDGHSAVLPWTKTLSDGLWALRK